MNESALSRLLQNVEELAQGLVDAGDRPSEDPYARIELAARRLGEILGDPRFDPERCAGLLAEFKRLQVCKNLIGVRRPKDILSQRLSDYLLGLLGNGETIRQKGFSAFFSKSPRPGDPPLALARMAFLLWFLTVSSGEAEIPASARSPREGAAKSAESSRYALTVVVGASQGELLERLAARDRLDPETAEALFNAAQWFHYSDEARWQDEFGALFNAPDQFQDEYDVYLVKIGLSAPEGRFARNSSMVRISDAFANLPKRPHWLRVSGRQPKEVYGGRGFYRL